MIEKCFECDWRPYIHAIGMPNGVLKNFVSPLEHIRSVGSVEVTNSASTAPLATSCHNGIMTIIDCKGYNIKRKEVYGSLETFFVSQSTFPTSSK